MIAILLVNGAIVAAAVLIHYEFLRQMTRAIARMRVRHRLRILFGLAGALIAHTVEVWVFATAYYFKHWSAGWGPADG